jgi:NAD(P)-dependent dehydrogenase (short-subunit alcohol dehydrogenase family)
LTDLFDLTGEVVLLTGGAGAIGESVARALIEHGATVVIADTNQSAGDALSENLGPKASFRAFDITDPTGVESMITSTVDSFGSINILVNAAYPKGNSYEGHYEEIKLEDWQTNIEKHLTSYFYTSFCTSLQMKEQLDGGSIINFASIYGFQAPDFSVYEGTDMTNSVEYAAIKGGILNLVRYMASYLGQYDIRVNAVSPGGVYNNQNQTFVDRYERRTALGRMASSDDIAGPVVFLASDASAYITGQNIIVDGGWSIQ